MSVRGTGLSALAALAACVVVLVPVRPGVAGAAEGVGHEGTRGVGLVSQEADREGGAADDAETEAWEEQIERHERRSRIVVGIFLGVVFLIFLLWWGRGKLYHRPRKL